MVKQIFALIFFTLTFSLYAQEQTLQISLDYPDSESEAALKTDLQKPLAQQMRSKLEGGIKVYPFGRPANVNQSYSENRNLREEDWARSQKNIALQNANEVFYRLRQSWSASEDISRHIAGLYLPYTQQLSFGFALAAGFYHLDDGFEVRNGDMYEFYLAGIYKYSTEVRMYGGLGASYDGDIFGPSLRSGVEYTNRSGVSFSFENRLWVPWTDNTISVNESGRQTGMSIRGNLPFRQKLILSFDLELDRYDLARDALSSKSYEGIQLQAGSRLGWQVWGVSNRRLPVDFLSPDNFSPDTFNTNMIVYTSVLAGQYFDRPEQSTVPVTERRFDHRIGIDASVAFNSFSGLRAGGYVGYDPARKIDFFKLYGFYSQLVFQPISQLKLYADFGMDTEAATGIAEGATWFCGGGLNYKF